MLIMTNKYLYSCPTLGLYSHFIDEWYLESQTLFSLTVRASDEPIYASTLRIREVYNNSHNVW